MKEYNSEMLYFEEFSEVLTETKKVGHKFH